VILIFIFLFLFTEIDLFSALPTKQAGVGITFVEAPSGRCSLYLLYWYKRTISDVVCAGSLYVKHLKPCGSAARSGMGIEALLRLY
jgi:hypothetical protein